MLSCEPHTNHFAFAWKVSNWNASRAGDSSRNHITSLLAFSSFCTSTNHFVCFFSFNQFPFQSFSSYKREPISFEMQITHPFIFNLSVARRSCIDCTGFRPMTSFSICAASAGDLGAIMMCKWLLARVWRMEREATGRLFLFIQKIFGWFPLSTHFVCRNLCSDELRKREFVCCFSRAGFHFVGFGDTHLNGVVLLFNGDVNYSAVKAKTSHDTHGAAKFIQI